MILLDGVANIEEIGGKALQLFSLKVKNTPTLRVVPSSFFHRAVATQRATFCMREGGSGDDCRRNFYGDGVLRRKNF